MAQINMSSIMSKVKQYPKTDVGKQRTQDTLKKYRKSGISKTEAGAEILTKPLMARLANELISILKITAQSYDLPPSVLAHFNSLTYMVEDLGNDMFQCYIYFSDDLSRESLETDENQGDGINNIVALFNNGYVASAPKYGWWNGHSPTGNAIQYATPGVTNNYAYVVSRQWRVTLGFMQSAIEDFYSKYRGKYQMSLTLSDEYEGHYNGSLNGTISQI